jgi:hypothetical protein
VPCITSGCASRPGNRWLNRDKLKGIQSTPKHRRSPLYATRYTTRGQQHREEDTNPLIGFTLPHVEQTSYVNVVRKEAPMGKSWRSCWGLIASKEVVIKQPAVRVGAVPDSVGVPLKNRRRCLKGVDVLPSMSVSETEYPQRDRVAS